MTNELKKIDTYFKQHTKLRLEHFKLVGSSLQDDIVLLMGALRNYKTVDVITNEIVTGRSIYNRTIKEIYRILSVKYNDLDVHDLYEALFSLLQTRDISSFICANIGKRVYFISYSGHTGYGGEDIDEYGISYTKLFKMDLPTPGFTYGTSFTTLNLKKYDDFN